jgi:zinc protease
VNAVVFAFKAPAGLAQDAYAVSLVTAILGEGKSSLLYQALVDTGLATDVSVEYPRFKDPSLIEVYAALTERATHEQIEKVVADVIEKISVDGPGKDDYERALNYVEAQYLYGMSSVSGTLGVLNEAISRGDWKDAWTFVRRLRNVTSHEVKQSSEHYLNWDSATIGYLHAV